MGGGVSGRPDDTRTPCKLDAYLVLIGGWGGGRCEGQGQGRGIQALAAMVFLIQPMRGRILVKTPGVLGRAQGVWPQDVIP